MRSWSGERRENKNKCSMEKLEGYGKFANRQKNTTEDTSFYDGCIRSVMLYGSETWAMTQKDEDIMKKCDRRMLRYMTGVKWKDGVSSKEVAMR